MRQEANATRAPRNAGTTPIALIEFELKQVSTRCLCAASLFGGTRVHGGPSGTLRVPLVLSALRILEAAVHDENNRNP